MSSVPGVDDRTESATHTAPDRGAAAADSALADGVLGSAAAGGAVLDASALEASALEASAVAGGPRRGWGAGLAFGLLSAAAFGTSGTFGSALIDAGWSPAGAVLARVSVAALVLAVPALIQLRGRWALLRRWG